LVQYRLGRRCPIYEKAVHQGRLLRVQMAVESAPAGGLRTAKGMSEATNPTGAVDTVSHLTKSRIALRYWLLGKGYNEAAAAMSWAESYHSGLRRGGAPEFSHQVAIASHLRTFGDLLSYPQECITVAFCHDVREDYDVEDAVVRERFGDMVADSVDAMTKEFRGVKFDYEDVFEAIGSDPIASVVKAADRVHNHSTMVGVFSPAKIEEYMAETREWFLPMIKHARRNFVEQEPVYESLTLVLRGQLSLLDEIVAGYTKAQSH
jgi:hypothetical protein